MAALVGDELPQGFSFDLAPDGCVDLAEQGRDVAAGNDAIVDLQHIKRAGQHQKIDHPAEQRDADHPACAFMQPTRDGVVGNRRSERIERSKQR